MALRSQIVGTGSYLPSRVVMNKDLEEVLDTSDEWIQQRTGITKRYWADQDESTSDLALKASEKALESAGIDKKEIDLLLLATVTPDHEFPGSACFLQAKMDIPGIPAIDVRQQCGGFIYALSMADQYIRTGTYKNVLVVCSELHSRCLDLTPRGRNLSVNFGDGAGAIVLKAADITDPENQPHVISTKIHSDGSQAKELWCPGPGTALKRKERVTMEMLEEGVQYPQMNGRAVFSRAVRTMSESLLESLTSNGKELKDLNLAFFHQANKRISEAIGKTMSLSDDLIHSTVEDIGNTTSATIPIGLDDAVRKGKLKAGMLISNVAFGSGFTWGHALIRW